MGFKFPRASDTVKTETTLGKTPLAGKLRSYSRGDHTHGTPKPCITYFGGAADIPPKSWGYLGWADITLWATFTSCVTVPSPKWFKLWALGLHIDSTMPSRARIGIEIDLTIKKQTALGAYYEDYSDNPYKQQGAINVYLKGYNDLESPYAANIAGFMLCTIEDTQE